MAMWSTAPSLQINGDGPLDQERRYAEFYGQILRLRDEVLAGNHPRLKVPTSVIEKTAPQLAQSQPHAARQASNGTLNGISSPAHPYTPHNSSSYAPPPPANPPRSSSSQRPLSSKPSASGIDPVLLTKSDDLVRAEIQLKRQRLERVLKDQVDQKRGRDNGVDVDARFDVSDVLAKAMAVVEPISGLRSGTNRNSPASDSFDENSYYSSQANSWSSEDLEAATGADAADTAAPKSNGRPKDGASKQNGGIHGALQPLVTVPSSLGAANANQDILEEGEESDYEPPGAEAFTVNSRTEDNTPSSANERLATANGPAQRQQIVAHGSLPSPTVPVIRNHIGTPIAPQPSRVSPLTFAKVPGLDTTHGPGGPEYIASGPASPRNGLNRGNDSKNQTNGSPKGRARTSPAHRLNPKKRRREAKEVERGEKQRRVSGKQRAAASPEPFIKEEPVSPPPFGDIAEPSEGRRRVVRPLADDVEIISPRESRTRPVYYMECDQPEAAPRYADEPGLIRVPSRATYRATGRDDQDLRRVASLQYARRPYSPYQPGAYETRPLRAISHAYVDGPASPLYREGSVRPGSTRYIRSERSLSPPYVTDPYQARARSPALMAPPPVPRRVVIDQYGNRFYAELPAANLRASMAPARRVADEPIYERARTREPTMRPAFLPVEDEELNARVASSQRRYLEEPEAEVVDTHRLYRQRDYSMRAAEPAALRDEFIPGREYAGGRPGLRYEEMPPPPPREFVARPYSVRPETGRREAATEYVTRRGSVAPGGEYARRTEVPQGYRAVSVVGEVPVEDRRYAYAAQHGARRFVDEPELLERPVSVVQDPYRMAYRY